jgi:radical SAM superfamily enzyme YgiQ (UPF0313 family)
MSIVAGALSNAGHEVRQFDFLQSDMSMVAVESALEDDTPEIIGISIRNIDNVNLLNERRYIEVVESIVRRIRQKADVPIGQKADVPIVLGGSGFSIMPEVILREAGADYGIVGEGESLMVEFVDNAARGIYPEERCIRATSMLRGAEISSPDYDPHLMEFYLKSGNIAAVQTKRGCSHGCVYCSYPALEGASIRCRDPKAVVDDIQVLIERHAAGYISFTDSVFNDDQRRYLEVIDEMRHRDVSIPWTAFFKPEGLDDESVKQMKETGLQSAEIGADATTDTTLKELGKPFLFRDIIESNDCFIRNGVATTHFYMFGGPGETEQTVLQGIDNVRSMKKTVSFIFMGLRILPNTPLARIARKQGLLSSDEELLDSVYYVAPGLDREWLERTLTDGFSDLRHCVFPPDSMDNNLQLLFRLGHTGFLWDRIAPNGKKAERRSRRDRRA